MKNEKVKNEKVKWFILDWKILKVMHQQTLNLHELVSLMDVAWLSIESILSYYWQWEQSLVMELQSSSLLHCQHYYLLGMSSTCVCICLMEGCVLYTSHQDDYASPGHMAMHISCCRCDISQKHANIFPSISQSVNCVNCICCVSSISDVECLWCEVVSDWDSLNWVIAWDVTTLSFTCSGLSLQTCLVDKWFASIVSFASFGCLQVNVLFGCFKEGLQRVNFIQGGGPRISLTSTFGKVIFILKSDLVNWVNCSFCSTHPGLYLLFSSCANASIKLCERTDEWKECQRQ